MNSWLDKKNIAYDVIAEFDDNALMKSFGQEGYGVFTAPSLIEKTIVTQYNVEIIGRTEEIRELYYAISPERRLKHPAILKIVNAAKKTI